jgi:hypothetical protein
MPHSRYSLAYWCYAPIRVIFYRHHSQNRLHHVHNLALLNCTAVYNNAVTYLSPCQLSPLGQLSLPLASVLFPWPDLSTLRQLPLFLPVISPLASYLSSCQLPPLASSLSSCQSSLPLPASSSLASFLFPWPDPSPLASYLSSCQVSLPLQLPLSLSLSSISPCLAPGLPYPAFSLYNQVIYSLQFPPPIDP